MIVDVPVCCPKIPAGTSRCVLNGWKLEERTTGPNKVLQIKFGMGSMTLSGKTR